MRLPLPPLPPPSPGAAHVASPGEPLAKRIESYYAAALPLKCDVDIELFAPAKKPQPRTHMSVVLVRPGRFFATFSTGELLVVDAQLETLSNPRTQQVRQRAVPADHCPAALAFACAPGALAQHLVLESYPGQTMSAPAVDVLVGSPRAPSAAGLRKLLFHADNVGAVKRMLFVDASGRERHDVIACTKVVAPVGPLLGSVAAPVPNPAARPQPFPFR